MTLFCNFLGYALALAATSNLFFPKQMHFDDIFAGIYVLFLYWFVLEFVIYAVFCYASSRPNVTKQQATLIGGIMLFLASLLTLTALDLTFSGFTIVGIVPKIIVSLLASLSIYEILTFKWD